MDVLLKIKNLKISFYDKKGRAEEVVHGIDFELKSGESLAIVGESGSGKSVSMMAIGGLLDRALIEADQCEFHGRDSQLNLLNLDENKAQEFRANSISYIFQEPMTALNPLMKCGDQVAEGITKITDQKEKQQKVLGLFEEVQLPDIERIFNSYPHELSGGQRQRVMIAMALANDPELIIADEPTTALDAVVQDGIIELLANACQERNTGLIFISHDLNVVRKVAENTLVMLKGKIVEKGATQAIFESPKTEYTKGLLASKPLFSKKGKTLSVYNSDLNITEESEDLEDSRIESDKPLLSLEEVDKTYTKKRGLFFGKLQETKAVKAATMDVFKGEALGLVGESGCGKSTLAKITARLVDSTAGTLLWKNEQIDSRDKSFSKKVQMIFQDPYSSLNPVQKIGNAIAEPILVHKVRSNKSEAKNRVVELLEDVGLSAEDYQKYPHEFSGGQRQRICIARALAIEPELIICDESVSALDVSVQAKILNLLQQLKKKYQLTYLFISHDLNVVSYFCDRIVVMKDGEIIEINSTKKLLENPNSEYSRNLLSYR